jgi:hypothetical protein
VAQAARISFQEMFMSSTTPITVEEITGASARKGATRESHESYGMISFSRISSTDKVNLFGSDVTHTHLIQLSVQLGGERTRDLNHDWYHASGPMALEALMSEAQFAQMVTSLNMGVGVPCTVCLVGDRQFSMPEQTKPVIERFTAEAERYIAQALQEIGDVRTAIQSISDGEKKATKETLKDLLFRLEVAQRNLTSNQEYLTKCAQERLEKMHAEAVAEFEAHVNASLTRRGLESMTTPPPQLGKGADDES